MDSAIHTTHEEFGLHIKQLYGNDNSQISITGILKEQQLSTFHINF